jgi:hypothetical protein
MESIFDDFFKSRSEIDLVSTCPLCLKKIGLESRFVSPLPFTIKCPYCPQEWVIAELPKSKDKK